MEPNRFSTSRTNFTRFSRDGGGDERALGRAVRSYARSAAGGSRNATARMGASRQAASKLLGVLRDFEAGGVRETFRRLRLDDFLDQGLAAALGALIDRMCEDGGPIDEAIARIAWVETVDHLEELGVGDLDAFDAAQRQGFFADFLGNSIIARILHDIGVRGFRVAPTAGDFREIERTLRDYVSAATRDGILGLTPRAFADLTDRTMGRLVEGVYEVAWALLETYGAEGEAT